MSSLLAATRKDGRQGIDDRQEEPTANLKRPTTIGSNILVCAQPHGEKFLIFEEQSKQIVIQTIIQTGRKGNKNSEKQSD